MCRKFHVIYLFIILMVIILNTGCSTERKSNKIAYISANEDSNYKKTFKELHLGELFDFNIKLPNADKSWVNIWVEGYNNGKPMEPFKVTHLSYGLSPNKIEEGQMGFGVINPNNDPQLFLYSTNVSTNPNIIDKNFFKQSSISTWDYAIGAKTIGLEDGEEVILAVYRQGEESLATGYDYKDLDSVNKMINEDTAVLLLKIKVEKRNK